MWWMHDGFVWNGGWWMALGWVWMLVFWGSLIGLAVWGINRLTPRTRAEGGPPLDIAKARYARGEIDREEFEQLKRDLS